MFIQQRCWCFSARYLFYDHQTRSIGLLRVHNLFARTVSKSVYYTAFDIWQQLFKKPLHNNVVLAAAVIDAVKTISSAKKQNFSYDLIQYPSFCFHRYPFHHFITRDVRRKISWRGWTFNGMMMKFWHKKKNVPVDKSPRVPTARTQSCCYACLVNVLRDIFSVFETKKKIVKKIPAGMRDKFYCFLTLYAKHTNDFRVFGSYRLYETRTNKYYDGRSFFFSPRRHFISVLW